MSPSATPATHSAAAPRATNSDQARHQSRPSAHVSVFPGCHPWFSSHGQYPVSAVPRLQLYRIPLISFLSLDSACKLCSVLMLCLGRVESKTKTLRGGVTQLLHFTLIKGSGGGELRRNLRLKKDKKEGGWWWPAEERDLANLIGMSKEKGGGGGAPPSPFCYQDSQMENPPYTFKPTCFRLPFSLSDHYLLSSFQYVPSVHNNRKA